MTTIHANTPRDAVTRLEQMVGMAGIPATTASIRAQIASAAVSYTHLDVYKRQVLCWWRANRSIPLVNTRTNANPAGGNHSQLGQEFNRFALAAQVRSLRSKLTDQNC